MSSDLGAMYLLGLASGVAIGAVLTFVAMSKGDGWQDVRKGTTTKQLFERAGIGVGKKED